MKNSLSFGKYLKQLRLKKGLTLKELAGLAGLSPSYLSRIERGKRNIPNARFLNRLAPHLDISPQEIMIAAGYLNKKADEPVLYEKGGNENSPPFRREIVKDPALHAAFEEIEPLSKDEKEGLLLFLKAIKLRRNKEK
ncbi:MAG: helix-turn-helix domain-containing protein [Firmicutes bacterium]|nr:helix-turn-helix domain-containing protein [Bacillota bacterium]